MSAPAPVGPDDAVEAARAGIVRLPPDESNVHVVSGRDAFDLLQRLASASLAPVEQGRAVATLFLTGDGRILHRCLVAPAGEGRLRVVSERVGDETFEGFVDRYVFAEDVAVANDDALSVVRLVGTGLEGAGFPASGADLLVAEHRWGALPAVTLAGSTSAVEEALERTRATGAVRECSEAAALQLRVEAGAPAVGRELTGERFPLECDLADEVSLDKGCYPGQEVVARQDTYGKVARRLVGLICSEAPMAGEEIEGGRGQAVTSVAPQRVAAAGGSPEGVACLAFVRTASAEPGAEVTIAGRDAPAVVVELPFARLR